MFNNVFKIYILIYIPISHLAPENPWGQEHLPFTQAPPFRQAKSQAKNKKKTDDIILIIIQVKMLISHIENILNIPGLR